MRPFGFITPHAQQRVRRAYIFLGVAPIPTQRVRPRHASVLVGRVLRVERKVHGHAGAVHDDVAPELLGAHGREEILVVRRGEREGVHDVLAPHREEVDGQTGVGVVPYVKVVLVRLVALEVGEERVVRLGGGRPVVEGRPERVVRKRRGRGESDVVGRLAGLGPHRQPAVALEGCRGGAVAESVGTGRWTLVRGQGRRSPRRGDGALRLYKFLDQGFSFVRIAEFLGNME